MFIIRLVAHVFEFAFCLSSIRFQLDANVYWLGFDNFWFTGLQLMDRISLHRTMRFMIVLMPWACKRIFSEAFMHMVAFIHFLISFYSAPKIMLLLQQFS